MPVAPPSHPNSGNLAYWVRRKLRALVYRELGDGLLANLFLHSFLAVRRLESQILVFGYSLVRGVKPAFFGWGIGSGPTQPGLAFIIGKGPSSQLLSAQDRDLIAQNYSIFLNDASIPGLKPNLRLQEQRRPADGDAADLELEFADTVGAAVTLTHITVSAGAEPTLAPGPPLQTSQPRTYLYSSTNFGTTNVSKASRHFVRSALRRNIIAPSVVMGSQASLLRAVWLALRRGFENIVLVGCELSVKETSSSTLRLHLTAIKRSDAQIPVQDLISGISQELGMNSGGRLLNGSPGGLLDGRLETFNWTLERPK